MKVPYINLGLQHQKDKAALLAKFEEILDSGMFILGQEVEDFEKDFAQLCGAKYAVGVANGTDALMLAMQSLGIGKGDEVITAPNSYLASASSIELVGATAVFADVKSDFTIDPEEVRKKITPKTKAIIAVHLTGKPADMDAINALAEENGIAVIEDSAQAVGAKYKGQGTGSLGKIGCFSLHPLKNLAAAGDAGIITTNDESLYQWLMKARTHGMKNRDECEFWSVNSRIDALQAAILNIKLPRLEEWTQRRRAIAEKYRNEIGQWVHCPNDNEDTYSVYHTFIVQTDQRDALQAHLKSKGIDSKIHYPIAIHQQAAASNNASAQERYPMTEQQVKTILSLPVYPELTDEQVQYICDSVKSYFNALA